MPGKIDLASGLPMLGDDEFICSICGDVVNRKTSALVHGKIACGQITRATRDLLDLVASHFSSPWGPRSSLTTSQREVVDAYIKERKPHWRAP